MDITPDILERVHADFPSDEVEARLAQLAAASPSLRILRCIVFAARGHPWYFDYLCKLAKVDDRDVIMAAEYERLGTRLYDFTKPFAWARIDHPYGPFQSASESDACP